MGTVIEPVCGARAPSPILCSEDGRQELLPKEARKRTGGMQMTTTATYGTLSASEHSTQLRKAVIASTIGTAIEWCDFFLYGTAAGLIFSGCCAAAGPAILPSSSRPSSQWQSHVRSSSVGQCALEIPKCCRFLAEILCLRTATSASHCRSNPVSHASLLKTGIFQTFAGDFWQFRLRVGRIWSLETDREFAKNPQLAGVLRMVESKSTAMRLRDASEPLSRADPSLR